MGEYTIPVVSDSGPHFLSGQVRVGEYKEPKPCHINSPLVVTNDVSVLGDCHPAFPTTAKYPFGIRDELAVRRVDLSHMPHVDALFPERRGHSVLTYRKVQEKVAAPGSGCFGSRPDGTDALGDFVGGDFEVGCQGTDGLAGSIAGVHR